MECLSIPISCDITLSVDLFKEIPTVNAEQINALAETDTWISEANNIIIFGASGLGKTHLLHSIAWQIKQNEKFFSSLFSFDKWKLYICRLDT